MTFSLVGFIKGLLVQHEADRSKQLSLEVDTAATTSTKTILKSAQTANQTLTLPDATDTLMGKNTVDIVTNKSIDADGTGNVITNIDDGNIKALAAIDASKLADGSVSNAELQFINSLTSNAQTQLTNNATAISDHLSDATDAHDASAISNIPSGNLAATDLQAAVNELQSDVDSRATATGLSDHISDPTGAHTASAITNVPSGNLVATDVQAALNEIQTQVDGIVAGGEVNTASNVGIGAGLSFKQKVGVDLQFRTIKAGTNITITNNTDDITIDAAGSSGANVTLSNLTSPTDINQDLLFDNGAAHTLGFESAGTNPGRSLTIQAGTAAGTDISGGALTLSTGTSTGSAGSNGIHFYMPASGQASGVAGRSALLHTSLTSTTTTNNILIKAPSGGGTDVTLINGTTSFDITPTAISSASAAPKIKLITGQNSGAGDSGELRLESGPKTVAGNTGHLYVKSGNATNGNSGSYFLETGSVTSGTARSSGSIQLLSGSGSGTNTSSGNISVTTGNATGTGTRGTLTLDARNVTIQSPIIFTPQTVGITATENQLVSSTTIVQVTTVGISTINGIAAGTEGQLIIIQNVNANNLSFTNLSGSASAADQILTQTGATITSSGISMHQLVYLGSKWQYLSGTL